MAEKFTFRLAAPQDLDPVFEVYRDVCLWLNDVKGITNQWDRDVAQGEIQELIGSGQLYLALLATRGEVAGAFKLNEQDHHWESDGAALYVHAVAVNRKFKGQGIGRAMLDWAVNEARRRGKQSVRLDCMNENLRLKQVYADAGFEFWGIDPQHAGSALFEKKVGKEMLTQTLQHKTLIAAPAGYAWRPYRREDVPALYQMLLAADRADERQSNMTLEDMQRQFDDPWSNPETDSLLAFTADGQVAAIARVFVNPMPEEECRTHVWGQVHPEQRGRGLGEAVLTWMEARGRQRLEEMPADLPHLLRTNCQDNVCDSVALFEQHGFRRVRYAYRMRRDLSQPIPAAPMPDGLTLRPYSREFDCSMLEALNESFRDHWGFEWASEEDWRMFFVGRSTFRPDMTFLAVEGNEVMGLCFTNVNSEANERHGIKEGWIDDLGVRRPWRKRGVASALICQSMRAMKADGLDYATLGVDTQNPTGALGLYERLGFVAVRRTITFEKRV